MYIFNGQHNKEHLTDFLSYDVDTEHVEVISDFIKQDLSELPPLGYAQRASIDSDLDEIYVLSVSKLCDRVVCLLYRHTLT